ncbi:hypothetical protein [Paraburkholderia dinghuensis]|uniref:Beta-glucuronidase C-terminal domain-containing protein n=1 Tax=Paraburkholderia dinghuensis TaxID=2305225 RepID=A0A3N6N1L1_9BURK|nr:hypothetical protein [Paraburkholderia dinghuensis]RQH10054.1 hypothetical protein D1Y85_02675 [Paraburkholderia dinghuensis]
MKKTTGKRQKSHLCPPLPVMDRRTFVQFTTLSAALMLAGCGGSSNGGSNYVDKGASTSSGLTATLQIAENQIPGTVSLDSSFASLSFEKNHINTSPGVYFGPNNTSLIGLLNALGGGVLRIGGNSVDRISWTPAGAGQTSGQVSQRDVANFANFMKQCPGWRVLYGINFASSRGSIASPALAADEAAYVSQMLGGQLLAFEIGNEPDLYGDSNTPTLAGFTYSTFLNGGTLAQGTFAGWSAFAQAIRGAVAGAVLSGPAASSEKGGWAERFASSEAGNIALMTEHYYIDNYNSAAPSINGMLSTPDTNLIAALRNLQATSNTTGIPFRIGECNSYFSSSNPAGVSNVFAAALWAIDFIFTHAKYGASGLNFHNNGSISSYTAIGDTRGTVTAVQPLYYALAFFSQIFQGGATGKLLSSNLTANSTALSGYAIASSAGEICAIINNKDPVNAASVTIETGRSASQATITNLESSGATPLTNPGIYNGGIPITLGGQPISLNGGWTGAPQQTIEVSGQSLTANVAPATAALIRIA